MNDGYSIHEHIHRLAAWDASTSARASPLCRFSVSDGFEILEAAGFTSAFTLDTLPSPDSIDEVHRQWRARVIDVANRKSICFSHGVASKLVNSYLKARFVCGGYHEDARVMALHPPIDSVLLRNLGMADSGQRKLESHYGRSRNTGAVTSKLNAVWKDKADFLRGLP